MNPEREGEARGEFDDDPARLAALVARAPTAAQLHRHNPDAGIRCCAWHH